MCTELGELRQAFLSYAAGFDASLLSCAHAGEAVAQCAQIEAALASVKALAAARAAEGSSWKEKGFRSPADELAHTTKTSSGRAKRTLETGRRLAKQPEVAKAALAGELSVEQAAIVAEGVEANPARADQLIASARASSLGELSEEVARLKAAATDREARRQAIHARRYFRRWSDRDGALQGHLYGHLEDGASMSIVFDPIRRRLAALRAGAEARESFDALEYDALVAIADIAAGKDGELSLQELLDIGLFPQLDATMLARREPAVPGEDRPAPERGASSRTAVQLPGTAGAPQARGSLDQLFSLRVDPAGDERAAPEPDSSPGGGLGAGRAPDPTVRRDRSQLLASPTALEPTSRLAGPAGRSAARTSGSGSLPAVGAGQRPAPPGSSRRRLPKLAGSPIQVMVRVDADTLLRGVPLEGELCEIAGYGPVPVSVIEKLVANDNAFVVGVLTKSTQVLGIYRRRRRASAAQQSALQFLYPSCAVAGCAARAALEIDHREDWARTKVTAFDLLDRLCGHHHHLKTTKGWALVEGAGKRAFVPPDDPLHPAYRGRAADGGRSSGPGRRAAADSICAGPAGAAGRSSDPP